jgi:hypothetical protein
LAHFPLRARLERSVAKNVWGVARFTYPALGIRSIFALLQITQKE